MKPARNWFGVTMDETTSVRYTCTTSFPSMDPVFCTVTVTLKPSEVLTVEDDKLKLELGRMMGFMIRNDLKTKDSGSLGKVCVA